MITSGSCIFFAAASTSKHHPFQDLPSCEKSEFQSQPGLGFLGVGVDLVSFIPNTNSYDNIKHHVVKLSCGKNMEWRNPYLNTTYAIYDQVESIISDPSSTQDSAFFKFGDTFDLSEHFEESVSSGGLFGLFSASEEVQQMFKLNVKVNASLYYDYGKVNAFVAMLKSGVGASDEYVTAVNNLAYNWYLPENWMGVEEFFKLYGTHYIWKVNLGGEFRYTSICESIYLHAVGNAHAEAQASLDFLFLLHADGGASGDVNAAENFYQSSCLRHISCIGGDQSNCNKNSTDSWKQFVDSVNGLTPHSPGPGLTQAYYLPTHELLSSFWHPIKKGIVRDMMVAYVAWKGLEKLLEFYTITRGELNRIVDMEAPKCYISKYTWENSDDYGIELDDFTCGATPDTDPVDPFPDHPDPFQLGKCIQFMKNGKSVGDDEQVGKVVSKAQANAKSLLDKTKPHFDEMTDILKSKMTAGAKIEAWIEKTEQWIGSFKDMVASVYSVPVEYSCIGTADYSPQWCCDLCCWHTNDECEDATSVIDGNGVVRNVFKEFKGRRGLMKFDNTEAESNEEENHMATRKYNELQTNLKGCSKRCTGDDGSAPACSETVLLPSGMLRDDFGVGLTLGLQGGKQVEEVFI